MKIKTLVLTVGLPRSGKSTWSRKQNCPIVNPDSIRLALYGGTFKEEAEPMVWSMALYMVRALFYAGHSKIILDATNITKERRVFWENEFWDVEYHYLNTPKDICIERARREGNETLVPIIEKMEEERINEERKD